MMSKVNFSGVVGFRGGYFIKALEKKIVVSLHSLFLQLLIPFFIS